MRTVSKILAEFVTTLLLVISFLNVLIFLVLGHVESQLTNQGLNPHPLHWKMKSQPGDHQGSLKISVFLKKTLQQICNMKKHSVEKIQHIYTHIHFIILIDLFFYSFKVAVIAIANVKIGVGNSENYSNLKKNSKHCFHED